MFDNIDSITIVRLFVSFIPKVTMLHYNYVILKWALILYLHYLLDDTNTKKRFLKEDKRFLYKENMFKKVILKIFERENRPSLLRACMINNFAAMSRISI